MAQAQNTTEKGRAELRRLLSEREQLSAERSRIDGRLSAIDVQVDLLNRIGITDPQNDTDDHGAHLEPQPARSAPGLGRLAGRLTPREAVIHLLTVEPGAYKKAVLDRLQREVKTTPGRERKALSNTIWDMKKEGLLREESDSRLYLLPAPAPS